MKKESPKIVIDTNIIISALLFKGIPEEVLNLVFMEKVTAFISEAMIEEIVEVFGRKFSYKPGEVKAIENDIRLDFVVKDPSISLNITRDPDDNRVLEAAVEEKCQYIVTGDKDLLVLKKYKNIKILSAKDFLEVFRLQK